MIELIATSTFKKEFKRLKKKYPSLQSDLKLLINDLLLNPERGIDLGNGLRKIRISIKSKQRGKQGGARVITYNILSGIFDGRVFLVTIYDKSDQETISLQRVKELIKDLRL